MRTQTTTQKDSNNSNARELEQHKKTQTIMQDEWTTMQEDPNSHARGPKSNNARKTNHARGTKQAKNNSTYKLIKL